MTAGAGRGVSPSGATGDGLRRDSSEMEESVGKWGRGTQTYEELVTIAQLLYLASQGKTQQFAREIESKPELINCKDYDERSPLHLAASEGKTKMVQWLIDKGADINAVDRWKGTPLSDAVRGGKTEVVDILVKHGGLMMDARGELISFEDDTLKRNMNSNDWEIDPAELSVDETVKGGTRIGTGSFGTVHRASWRGTEVAIKRLHTTMVQDNRALALFRLEMSIMCSVAHPNVVQFLGACTTVRPLSIVTEFMPGGSLADIFRHVRMTGHFIAHDDAVSWALGTARGMAYLHGKKPTSIIHRDLKPANLLLDSGRAIKVTDFGLSKTVQNSEKKEREAYKMTGGTGSFLYMAPEVFRHESYSHKVDVYSFGMILFQLFENVTPFSREMGSGLDYVLCADRASKGERPQILKAPEDVASLICDCWKEDPDDRPSFKEIVERLDAYQKSAFYQMTVQPRDKEPDKCCTIS